VLREHLTLFRGCTLNELVSTSIEQEDACRVHLEEERKKRPLLGPNGGASPMYRLHIRQLWWQLQLIGYFASLLQNLERINESRCKLASYLEMMKISHR
jgi:hypothetical protein